MKNMVAVIFSKRSERFPGKHMKKIGDSTVIDLVARKLSESGLFRRVVIFTRDPAVRSEFAEVVADSAGGTLIDSIAAAIDLYGEIFAFAGDMPLLSINIIRRMLESYRGIPMCPSMQDGRLEPLHAVYNGSVVEEMRKYSESGKKSVQGFIRSSKFDLFEVSELEPFFNLNYPEDLERLSRLAGKEDA